MGFLTLADQLKNRIDPPDTTAAGAKAASGYQPGEYAGLPRVMPQTAPVQYDSPPPQQDVSQYSPEVIAPPSMRGMQVPGEQANIGPAPLPQDYQRQQDALFQPGPLQQRYSQAALNGPGEAPHGFLGHLKGAGLGFLLGGPVGAVTGAIAPGIPQRALFRSVQLPQLAQQADQEMQQQGQQRQGYHALAQSTGYDPITHQPTLPMLTQQNMLQHRNILENQGQQRIGIQQQRADEATRQHDMMEEYRQARLAQFKEGIQNGSHVLAKGADGNQYVVNKNDPTDAIMVADSVGRPIGSIDQMLEGGRNYRAQASEAGRNSRFRQGQEGVESRFQRSQLGQESRFQRGQEGMDRRAKSKRGGGLLEAARQQLGQGDQGNTPSAPAAPQSITRAIYNAMVKEKGQARTDAYVKARGLQVVD